MINQITFAAGSSASTASLTLDPRPITVLVGPNNSGKSATLREIEGWCKTGPQQERKVVARIAVDLPDVEQALAELEPFKRRPGAGDVVREGFITLRRSDPNQDAYPTSKYMNRHFTLHGREVLTT